MRISLAQRLKEASKPRNQPKELALKSRAQWLAEAEKLRGYFQKLVDEQGEFYARELELTEQWHRIIQQYSTDLNEISAFAQVVKSHENNGTAWIEVQYLVARWAREVSSQGPALNS